MADLDERILLAIEARDAAEVAACVADGADPNMRLKNTGRTLLAAACSHGDFLTVDALLAAGAHPSAAAPNGCTALHWAALAGNLACLARLLAAGADPNAAETHEYAPMHFACHNGHTACALALLEAGADPVAKTFTRAGAVPEVPCDL